MLCAEGSLVAKPGERVRVSVEDVEEGYALGPPFQSSLSFQHLKYTGLSKNMPEYILVGVVNTAPIPSTKIIIGPCCLMTIADFC